ncbi:MAG: DNA-processing protein DprA [Candidatus Margulisiibacteriota bacterium]
MLRELKYWLGLNNIPELGPVTIKRLWKHFGSIEQVWQATDFSGIEGLRPRAISSFLANRDKVDLDAELAKVEAAQVKVLTLADDDYPELLKHIYDPPPVIYYRGEMLQPSERSIAIVGTRRASRYGLATARKLASELAALGIVVVSGLAQGIDAAAHQAVVAAGGRTIAVFGTGVDVVFPADNKSLAEQIEMSGALVSEFPLGERGDRSNFPRRNRIISGLSLGVIVVEGDYKSGAMITAKEALEQGREVFAVPGNVGLEGSRGPHWLIKQGAKLVETVEDVLDELNLQLQTSNLKTNTKTQTTISKPENLSPEEEKIFAVISHEPKHIDAIAVEVGVSSPQAASILMMLELKKIVRQLPGKMFIGVGAE